MAVLYGDVLDPKPGMLVAVDTETTGLEYWDRCLGWSLAWKEGEDVKCCYIDLQEGQMGLFASNLQEVDDCSLMLDVLTKCQTIFANASFDYRVLFRKYRAPVPLLVHDVMHMAKLIGYSESFALLNLYEQYVGRYPEELAGIKKLRGKLSTLDPVVVAKYGAFDAVATLLVFEAMLPKVLAMVDRALYKKDLQVQKLALRMIEDGLPVDREFLSRKRQELESRRVELAKKYQGLGLDNPGSGDQLAVFLFEKVGISDKGIPKTKGGRPSLTADMLDELAIKYPTVEALQEVVVYRELVKCMSSWVDPLIRGAQFDGRVRSILSAFGTRSFRMSSSKLNLQAVPIKDKHRAFGSFKGAFIPEDPDEQLWCVDVKQAEVND